MNSLSLALSMNTGGDYLDGNNEYGNLYPQAVVESDSQDSAEAAEPVDEPTADTPEPSEPVVLVQKPPPKLRGIERLTNHGKHFECFCGKIFISKADYNRHMFVHTGERPHECVICGKAFSLKGNLTKHMMLHTDEKSYHCPECGKAFLKKSYVDQHMRIHTGEKPFVCPHCTRAFSLKGNLVQHIKLHTDDKTFHCMDCSKVFLKKSYLMQHMQVHTGSKPHKCPICNRGFNLKGNLSQHMKRHSGKKPHRCFECGKSFALKGALKEHEKVHDDDKPFICAVCSKAFSKKAYLAQHERTHTGERPFQCMECSKAFSQRSILNQHMKQHGERVYKCADCHKMFLMKLSDIPKHNKVMRFGGFKCPECETIPLIENPMSEESDNLLFKEEEQLTSYDSESYIRDSNVSFGNLDGAAKSEGLQKLFRNLTHIGGKDFNSSNESNLLSLPESNINGLSESVYDFPSHTLQPTLPVGNSDKKPTLQNYNQKKVAYAHTISRGKKLLSYTGKTIANTAENVDDVMEVPDSNKKLDRTYAELKVLSKPAEKYFPNNVKESVVSVNNTTGTTTTIVANVGTTVSSAVTTLTNVGNITNIGTNVTAANTNNPNVGTTIRVAGATNTNVSNISNLNVTSTVANNNTNASTAAGINSMTGASNVTTPGLSNVTVSANVPGMSNVTVSGNITNVANILSHGNIPRPPQGGTTFSCGISMELVSSQKQQQTNKAKPVDSTNHPRGDTGKSMTIQMVSEQTRKETAQKNPSVDNLLIRKVGEKNISNQVNMQNTVNENVTNKLLTDALHIKRENSNLTQNKSSVSESVPNDRSVEYAYKKHSNLVSIDPQVSIDYSQRSSTESSTHDAETKRSLLYGQPPPLPEYNSRNVDLRYIERQFPGIRQGNISSEMENALSRFGIKGYYNSPWSFTGNYPE